MADMSLSVIIPIYNASSYLNECLDSLISFSEVNPDIRMEILLVDDGSTDSSLSICNAFADNSNGKVDGVSVKVYHQNNSGVSVARNVGLDNASCDWVWFVDADDSVAAMKIAVNECDLLMFGCIWKEKGSAETVYSQDDNYSLTKDVFLLGHNSFLNQTMWFRREIIEKYSLRFTEGMKMGEDLEFQYKYLMVCSHPASMDANLYLYRVVEGSATNNSKSRYNIVNDTVVLFNNLLSFIKLHNVKESGWLADRLSRQMKTMIYSAGQTTEIARNDLQSSVRKIIDSYSKQGYTFMCSPTMRLAYYNVSLYILVNKVYQKLRS